MGKRQPKVDQVIRDVRVRVYASRTAYEVIFGNDDIEDMEAEVLLFPKLGTAEIWAAQGRTEYKGPVPNA